MRPHTFYTDKIKFNLILAFYTFQVRIYNFKTLLVLIEY